MGSRRKHQGHKRKKPHRTKAIERQQRKSEIVAHQKLIEWLIDENYPARRAAYLAGYIEEPQEYLATVDLQESEIQSGVVGGLLLNAGLTLLSGGSWLIAGIGLVAGLAQYALAPGEKKRAEDPRYAPSYGGSFGGRMARYGTTVPAIFCSKSLDPTGGVQTSGEMVHARIETLNGSQTSYSRYIISHGTIGHIDLSRTVINEQPISHFYSNNITLKWQNGTQTQAPAAFNFFSQNFPVNNNNGVGLAILNGGISANAASPGGGVGVGAGLITASYQVAPGNIPMDPVVGMYLTMYVTNADNTLQQDYPLSIYSVDLINQTFTCYENIVNTWTPIIHLFGTNWYTNAYIDVTEANGASSSGGGELFIQPTPYY